MEHIVHKNLINVILKTIMDLLNNVLSSPLHFLFFLAFMIFGHILYALIFVFLTFSNG